MLEEENSDQNLQFSLSISTDRDRFLRRTCSSCGRDFKTEIDEADLVWAVAPQFRRMGVEIGTDPDTQTRGGVEHLYCPYCNCHAEASAMLTKEMIDYLKHLVTREYVIPQFNKALSELDKSNKRSGGFISIDIHYSRSLLPPHPIYGPDLPDMKIIQFLCCRKSAKVADQWNSVEQCVYCGALVILV
jgi:hypothetical protein